MKHINQFITEYIIKKKLDKPIDSEDHYEYFPESKSELIKIINKLLKDNQTNLNIIDVSKITDMSDLFSQINENITITNIDISDWDVSNVTNMENMFFDCREFNCNLSKWDVSNVTTMESMFSRCENFTGEGLENWNISNVKNIAAMFSHCKKFDCDLSNWDFSKVSQTRYMFSNCENFDCDVSKWKFGKVYFANGMFYCCKKFKGIGLDKWDVSNFENMPYMFYKCENLNVDLENWNVKLNWFYIKDMFKLCSMKKLPTWYKK